MGAGRISVKVALQKAGMAFKGLTLKAILPTRKKKIKCYEYAPLILTSNIILDRKDLLGITPLA
jgi:hypothetical protein